MLNLFSSHLISSRCSFSWKLLIASHGRRSLRHPISSQLNSSHVFSACFTSFHLIPSHVFPPLLSSSQLVTTVLFSSHVTWALLISSELISACLDSWQLFSTLLSSLRRMSAHLMSSHLFSPLLTSSKLFSHLLSWSQLLSARLTSSQLFSAHSQIISALLWPKTCSKRGSRCQSKRRLRFPQRRFDTENLYTQQTFAQRSLYTQKLLHIDREAFTQRQGSFYSQQAFTQSKLFTQQAFTHSKLLHVQWHQKLQLESWISAPKPKKKRFWSIS